eukprot:SAG22_NODE_1060_length_5764_cov_2.176876_8_plen_59_part_00
MEMACTDLEKYNSALDKALIAYHGEKMKEVNAVRACCLPARTQLSAAAPTAIEIAQRC